MRIAVFGRAAVRICLLIGLSLMLPEIGKGSEFYTNWAAAHFSDIPSQSGPQFDPDGDGQVNLIEYTFGTDPRLASTLSGVLNPQFENATGGLGIVVYEAGGHRAGVQLDLNLSSDLVHWTKGWFQRAVANSQPGDAPGSVREFFTTTMPPTNAWFVRGSATLFDAGGLVANYYVAPNGSDSNNGTSTNTPYFTLNKAASVATAGQLIYLRGGTYNYTAKASLSHSGTAASPIRVRAFPGEHPVLNFTNEPFGARGIEITGKFWRLYGLEIANARDNGIYLTGASNVVEFCVAHGCADTGIHIHTGGSYNLILNCDSYRNFDPTNSPQGGNADGFACKFSPGPGNMFAGCRSWENSDDGWDLWEANTTVIISNCWTFRNGFNYFGATNFGGNGNGFKLGGNFVYGPHRICYSVSFGNAAHGYDQNNNTAGQTVDNNISWANAKKNFYLNHLTNTTPHVVRNNISFLPGQSDTFYAGTIFTNNSWQLISSPAVGTNDFLSVDVTLAQAPRRDDGGLPDVPFLRPVPTGRLINRGVYTGDTYQGSAPELGPFEAPSW
ncbi:MAG TPA: right-handed parallel beta-helix repeat-containing protein [Candidatus Dormibacteraeota bacterium]|nr:right-handed parallel beta-helix repeat-containing protein [Candidatus Dormibacteraeota bacterium]